VLNPDPDEVHEDEAARLLAKAFSGPGVAVEGEPSEGKVRLIAARNGLLKVNTDILFKVNLVPDISCGSLHTNTVVTRGRLLAAARAIPLLINEEYLHRAEELAREAGGIFEVKELSQPKAGLVVTGNEVYSGLIKDKFGPVVKAKLNQYGCSLKKTVFTPDNREVIADAIQSMIEEGVGLIIVAGGMSVDPDDVSRLGIADAGAVDIVYGTPVMPGAMFLYGRIGELPVLGLPACTIFSRATVLDLILPRVLAGESISRADLAGLAHGGLCLECEQCQFPVCPFGK